MSLLWSYLDAESKSRLEPGTIVLSTEESRHVTTRRLRMDDALVVFDGQGRLGTARVCGLAKKAVEVEIDAVQYAPVPDSGFVMATAIPKGDRLSAMLQMWTQLGLEVWQPLVCADSAIRKLDVDASRLRRILIEGCKVARRPWAMTVLPPIPFDEAMASRDLDRPLYYGDREGKNATFSQGAGTLFIGPEAGFTAEEKASLAAASALPVSFGEFNLRIETAAVAAIAAFNATRSTVSE